MRSISQNFSGYWYTNKAGKKLLCKDYAATILDTHKWEGGGKNMYVLRTDGDDREAIANMDHVYFEYRDSVDEIGKVAAADWQMKDIEDNLEQYLDE